MEEKKCILIVEDERAIVEILKFNLKREGYDTLEALDGEAGLELARTEDPDLILLDVMLPKMNGFDICKNLREAGSSVPIIMLTAREEETDKVFGLEAGADDYMTKPFSMPDFCMTALFVTIFIDQWETVKTHTPALAGLCVAVLALAIFGANGFMLPALLATSGILIFVGRKEVQA